MKKVLVITYYWPPSGGSGVQRWMYFCKYLKDFGYEPIVITVSEKSASYKNEDLGFLEIVKDVEVHKTKSMEPLKFYSWLTTGNKKSGIPTGNITTSKKSITNRISLYVRGNFFIPDARIGWNKFAVKKAKELIAKEKINLVITTGPPNSTHLMGLELKKNQGIKWIADFRDPWTDIYYNKIFNRSKRAQSKDERLEKEVLSTADAVTTVGVRLRELLLDKVTGRESDFHVLYNGFDSFAMSQLKKEENTDFQITMIGLLNHGQPYKPLKQALKKVHQLNSDFKAEMNLAGNLNDEIVSELKAELPFVSFNVKGYLSHKSALQLMKQADLLINLLPDMDHSEILISGKQMEYIATGNPILCIGNTKGECATLLSTVDNSEIFEKVQEDEMATFVSKIYSAWSSGKSLTNTNDDQIADKSRYEVSRKLAHLLDTFESDT